VVERPVRRFRAKSLGSELGLDFPSSLSPSSSSSSPKQKSKSVVCVCGCVCFVQGALLLQLSIVGKRSFGRARE